MGPGAGDGVGAVDGVGAPDIGVGEEGGRGSGDVPTCSKRRPPAAAECVMNEVSISRCLQSCSILW